MKEEQSLIERARNGETAAFRELVERHKKKIYYLALDMTGNHHDAEDMSQEVFIKAYRYLNSFRGDAKLSSWLYRITVNTCYDHRRKKSLTSMEFKENLDEMGTAQQTSTGEHVSENPEQRAEASVIQNHIQNALQRLSLKERSVFVLRHYNHFQLKEIAYIMDISLGTVKSTLFRAVERLQKELSFYRADLGLENANE